jgi:HD-like signal output (HDOD) protein
LNTWATVSFCTRSTRHVARMCEPETQISCRPERTESAKCPGCNTRTLISDTTAVRWRYDEDMLESTQTTQTESQRPCRETKRTYLLCGGWD